MIDPISIQSLVSSPEFQVAGVDDAAPAGAAASGGKSFGGLLGDALGKLDATLQASSGAAQDLATGKATDVTGVVMDVERASLELQLATQVRNKAVDAYQEIFRMQI
jgi:flagellar hook-basal body complex protein FliE